MCAKVDKDSIKKALRPDSWEALDAINRKFGSALYDAKDETCRAAFISLRFSRGREDKLRALGEHLGRWIDANVDAIRTYAPQYAGLADAAGVPREKKWHWVDDALKEKLRNACVDLAAPPLQGLSWRIGPIETWTPLEWWLLNACNPAPEFLILRPESASTPEWLSPTTNPTRDPIGYYDTKLKMRLGTALQQAVDDAKIAAAIGVQPIQAFGATGTEAAGIGDSAREGTGSPLPDSVLLGKWADEMLQQAKAFANRIHAGEREETLRSTFPDFFSQVIDRLYDEKRKRFFDDARGRRLTANDLLAVLGEVKSLSARRMGDLRKHYRKAKGGVARQARLSPGNAPKNTPK